MRDTRFIRANARLALIATLLVACQAYRPVTDRLESPLLWDKDTEVRVTEKSGARSRLVDTYFEHDSLIGRNFTQGDSRQAIATTDIVTLEIGELDTGQTVALVLSFVLVALVGLYWLALSSGT